MCFFISGNSFYFCYDGPFRKGAVDSPLSGSPSSEMKKMGGIFAGQSAFLKKHGIYASPFSNTSRNGFRQQTPIRWHCGFKGEVTFLHKEFPHFYSGDFIGQKCDDHWGDERIYILLDSKKTIEFKG